MHEVEMGKWAGAETIPDGKGGFVKAKVKIVPDGNGGYDKIYTPIHPAETINILGTDYAINVVPRSDDKLLSDMDGCCDDSTKQITIADVTAEDEPDSKRDLEAVKRKILRHEIVHAFLCESGLAENSEWAQNEELVDWIAIQGLKIYKAWQEAGAV